MTIHHDIDRVFKDGLADHTHKPPGFVWDNIDLSLNKKRIRKRRNTIYSIAASGALLISFGAGYLFNLNNPSKQQMAQQTEQQIIVTEEEPKNEALIANPVVTSDEVQSNNATEINNETENKENKKKANTVDDAKPESTTPNTPKAKKVSSSGTLLPPMFATGNTYEEEENAMPPIFIEEEESEEEAKLIGMHMQARTLENNPPKRELKYAYRETPMYGDAYYDETPKKHKNKWALAVSAAPLMSYRDLTNSSMSYDAALYSADNTSSYEQGYNNEEPLVSYSVGTNISYKVSKRWKVHSGIYVSEIGQTTKNIDLNNNLHVGSVKAYDRYAINTSYGNITIKGATNELMSSVDYSNNTDAAPPGYFADNETQSNDLSADLVQTLDYIEIPLLVSYKVVDRKLGINLSGGVSANILYDNSIYLEENGSEYYLDADESDLKSANYNGIIGLGMEYPIITQLFFNFQPTLRYSLSPINNSGTVYPYSFGLYTGLRYNF